MDLQNLQLRLGFTLLKCSWQYVYKITEVDDWIWDLREDKTEKQRTEEEKEQDNSFFFFFCSDPQCLKRLILS